LGFEILIDVFLVVFVCDEFKEFLISLQTKIKVFLCKTLFSRKHVVSQVFTEDYIGQPGLVDCYRILELERCRQNQELSGTNDSDAEEEVEHAGLKTQPFTNKLQVLEALRNRKMILNHDHRRLKREIAEAIPDKQTLKKTQNESAKSQKS
jgi:hypothetical protein